MPKQKRSAEDDKLLRQTGSANNNEDLSPVTFKYPGRFATLTRTIYVDDDLSVKDLMRRVSLCTSQQPPDAKKLFEMYYYDEILPFINKHAQENMNTRKQIDKSWDLQTAQFQKIYIKRADLLRQKWQEMKGSKRGNSSNSSNSSSSSSSFSPSSGHHAFDSQDHENQSNNTSPRSASTPKQHPHENSTTVIFKYYSVHSSAKTNRHIFITPPSKQELIDKIGLSLDQTPPSAKELFEIYYYDEILPFLKKSGQQSIRGKKDLSKVWQIQTKTFKGLYEDRSKILTDEWLQMKKTAKEARKKKLKQQKELRQRERQRRREQREYEKQQQALLDNKNKDKEEESNEASTPSSTPKQQMNGGDEQQQQQQESSEAVSKKVECSLVRTLLNFLLFIECTTKEHSAMLLIADQNERHAEYTKFEKYLKRFIKSTTRFNELVFLHLRVYIDNFDADHLRLHTGKQVIKLCFVNNFHFELESTENCKDKPDGEVDGKLESQDKSKQIDNDQEQRTEPEKLTKQKQREEELVIFELQFNKLINGLEDKIDHEHIEANLDDETRILSINVPLL